MTHIFLGTFYLQNMVKCDLYMLCICHLHISVHITYTPLVHESLLDRVDPVILCSSQLPGQPNPPCYRHQRSVGVNQYIIIIMVHFIKYTQVKSIQSAKNDTINMSLANNKNLGIIDIEIHNACL